MSFFRRFATFILRSRWRSPKYAGAPLKKSRRPRRGFFSSKPLECRVRLLDGVYSIITLDASSLGCDLINHVLIQLDLVERDYFSLMYVDYQGNQCWLDPVKPLKKQLKRLMQPYDFHFCVKFYAIDPDQLTEELTRYHFFLQLRNDIKKHKLMLTDHMAIELAALALQSELGDFDPQVHVGNYMSEALIIRGQNQDFDIRVAEKHQELSGCTPAECEVRFLKLIKYNELYGIERYLVQGDDDSFYDLGLAPRGIILLKDYQKIGFYPWNRINMVGFKKRNIRIFIQNRLDTNIIDKYNYYAENTTMAKCLWKSAIEHHSFFRLIRVIKNPSESRGSSHFFGSKFRYSGRTFYEASSDSIRLSKRHVHFMRSKSVHSNQRSTVGYIRVGSRVYARADNGEYFRGQVVALSDKVYVRCDDGITLAHPKTTPDGVVYDNDPDPSELSIGSRVIAHWPGISAYLTGNVSEIDGTGNYARYLIAFDDGDNHWNNADQIRLLKPPMYFGPGSNSTYLQKKFSMIKTTTLINAQITPAPSGCSHWTKSSQEQPHTTIIRQETQHFKTVAPPYATTPSSLVADDHLLVAPLHVGGGEVSPPKLSFTTLPIKFDSSQDSSNFPSSFKVPTIDDPLNNQRFNPPTLSTDL